METATARENRMTAENGALTIDVVSDVVCPWCYLGEKRHEAALAEDSRPAGRRRLSHPLLGYGLADTPHGGRGFRIAAPTLGAWTRR